MPRIVRLSSELANQIAAGEVVERPASVVKELVENALDAGARRIVVSLEFGGKRLVRVEDDGEGMTAEDARLAVERHATSKIRRAEDLASISTLGFRGEALPSIASVSHFALRTRAQGEFTGTEIRINAGVIAAVSEAGVPEGTRIDVEDLFYNLPARRKFLKSDQAETTHASRMLTQLALSAPEVGFTLTSAGRSLLDVPPVRNAAERLYQLYGDPDALVPVSKDVGGLRITGFVAALAEQGPRRGPQNVFVNGRLIRDRTIAHAIGDAYSVASIKERSPEVHLFIEMPLDAVDVNVHPTKAEVRFREQSLVHEVVRRAVADALGRGPAPLLALAAPAVVPAEPGQSSLPGVWASTVVPTRWVPDGAPRPLVPIPPPETAASPSASAVSETRPMIPLGQFRDTFIIAVDEEGIAIIDQHVAHERILFERTMERLSSGRLESQRLLEPLIIDVSSDARQALVAHASDLDRLGFELEDFGGTSLRVTAVPALLDWGRCEAALRAVATDLDGLAPGAGVTESLRQLAATMACHAAVKANDPLTREKMQYLLDELRRTAHSSVCPHGRPVVLRLTRREIERNFERI